MKYLDEFRDKHLAENLLAQIEQLADTKVNFMEVCGTHTMAIFRSGIKKLLPKNINLLSGPGCPVCVTADEDIDKAIAITDQPEVILTTFGDMLRVPGTESSLIKKRAEGKDIRIVYGPLDALQIAQQNPDKQVVFVGVGFETTAPTIAATIKKAKELKVNNFSAFSFHKLVPPALKILLDLGEIKLDGFLLPGHVSAIIGPEPYQFLARDYKIPCVIGGFEPLDILASVRQLLQQVKDGKPEIGVEYSRVVQKEGNPKAREILTEVFDIADCNWRGLGMLSKSGLVFKKEYAEYDAEKRFEIRVKPACRQGRGHGSGAKACKCGEILRGVKKPNQCKLFANECTPEKPIGPCMVSTEGTCAAYYKYER